MHLEDLDQIALVDTYILQAVRNRQRQLERFELAGHLSWSIRQAAWLGGWHRPLEVSNRCCPSSSCCRTTLPGEFHENRVAPSVQSELPIIDSRVCLHLWIGTDRRALASNLSIDAGGGDLCGHG